MADERRGRAGEQHLAAVARVTDAGRLVDGEADVAVGANVGLAGVQPHAHAHLGALGPLVLGEGPLGHAGGLDRCARTAEDDEERVALRVDLDPAAVGERLAQHPVVGSEHLAVAVTAKPLEQARRALDVGEQKRHRARRQGGRSLTYWRCARLRPSRGRTPGIANCRAKSAKPWGSVWRCRRTCFYVLLALSVVVSLSGWRTRSSSRSSSGRVS